MSKYKLIKETNIETGSIFYWIEERHYIFWWKVIYGNKDIHATYRQFLRYENSEKSYKDKFKREGVAIDNVYI